MRTATFSIWAVLILAVAGGFIRQLGSTVGAPNFVPALRDPLLLAVAVWGAGRLNLFSERRWPVLLALICVFVSAYLLSSMIEDRAVAGLYYLRIYMLPMLFFVGVVGYFTAASDVIARGAVRGLLYWNATLVVGALVIYGLLQAVPTLRPTLFGNEQLPAAWYISGGAWMRMGLPASGPNSLGLILALNAFAFIAILLRPASNRASFIPGSRLALIGGVAIALIGLVMTFSRSSILLLVVGGPLLLTVSGALTFKRLLRLTLGLLTLLGLVVISATIADAASDGFVDRWIQLNTRLSDPSMLGHVKSIQEAFDNLHDYGLWGYPRGSVGPKGFLFTGAVNNVENSLLGIWYDMGLPLGAVYVLTMAVLFGSGYRHPVQWPLLVGFGIPCLLLPYVFEADVLIYFSFIYILLGRLHPAQPLGAGHARMDQRPQA